MMAKKVVEITGNIPKADDLFSLYATQLAFPHYFSRNWDSFEEVISDLSWIKEEEIVLLHNVVPLLESPSDLKIYLAILVDIVDQRRTLHHSYKVLFE